MLEDRNVVLIGMPAAGKSTVGVLLAKRIGYGFVDTDLVIQTNEGATLPEIMATHGVEGFRDIEARHAGSLAVTRCVVATGGSVVYRDACMNALSKTGIVVWLRLGLEGLEARLSDLDERGVARQPGQGLEDLFSEREPLYAKWGRLVIECDGKTPEDVVWEIRQKIHAR